MKNIHVLRTDKPSRLQLFEGINEFEFELCSKDSFFNKGVHIYITSDEKIKLGDWVIEFQKGDNIGEVHFIDSDYVIANNIQKKIILTTDQDLIKDGVQEIPDEFLEWFVKNPSCEFAHLGFTSIIGDLETKRTYKIIIPTEEPKQERIGDFIKRESTSVNESIGIIKGANWQQERMYSEEEVIDIFFLGRDTLDKALITKDEALILIEQFKKK